MFSDDSPPDWSTVYDMGEKIRKLEKRLKLAEAVCHLAWADCMPNPRSLADKDMNEALEAWRNEGEVKQ